MEADLSNRGIIERLRKTGYVNDEGRLNVRSSPKKSNGNLIYTLDPMEELTILFDDPTHQWYYISTPNGSGWAMNEYIIRNGG